MSDQHPEGAPRSPDEYVKRAPTVANSNAIGTAASSIGLLAYWIEESLTHKHFMVPSVEMILWLIGLAVPTIHIVYKVWQAKINKWAASQGVPTNGG